MNLAELERYFAKAATSGSGPLAELDRVFLGSERLSATDRLAIYNRGYFYRLLDALASVFAQTKRVLGDSDFERLGLDYIARYPSDHPAVERIGRSFSAYLSSVAAPLVIVDLAALEWARLCALVAPNPSRIATVQVVDPSLFPKARLRFVPSVRWLELDPRALSAFAGGSPSAESEPFAPMCGVAVWRNKHAVQHQALEASEWKAMLSAAGGATLSQVCSVFDTGSEAEDVRRAFDAIASWFARQWLESIGYEEPPTSG